MKLITATEGLSQKEKHVEKVLEFDQTKVINIQLKAGQVIPNHDAAEHVMVIVRKGKILFEVEGKESVLTVDTFIYLEPYEKHSLKATEDSDVLVLRIGKSIN